MSTKNLSLVAAAALCAFATAATAADMPVKAAPRYAPQVSTWTGLYAGLNVGYGMGRSDLVDSSRVLGTGAIVYNQGTDLSVAGLIGGGQVGYNWQMSNWLFGLEADYQGSGQRGTNSLSLPASLASTSDTVRLKSFGTVRGRLGIIANDTNLWYVTGGYVYGKTELASSGINTFVVPLSGSGRFTNSSGWTIGGGVETKLVGNWTAKAEYLYMDMGTATGAYNLVTTGGVAGVTNTTSADLKDHVVRVGVNYKFF